MAVGGEASEEGVEGGGVRQGGVAESCPQRPREAGKQRVAVGIEGVTEGQVGRRGEQTRGRGRPEVGRHSG